jgi:hypothetical protein
MSCLQHSSKPSISESCPLNGANFARTSVLRRTTVLVIVDGDSKITNVMWPPVRRQLCNKKKPAIR